MRVFVTFFLFSTITLAQDYQQFCFTSKSQASKVQKDIAFLVLPSDKLKVNNKCLDIVSSANRLKLFNKFIYQNYRSDLTVQKETLAKECHLNIYQDELPHRSETKIQAKTTQPQNLKATAQESKMSAASKTQLILTHEIPGRFMYQGSSFRITCSPQADGYQVSITSQSPELTFKTQRYVKKGERIELGQLTNKSQKQTASAKLGNQETELTHQSANTSSETIVSIEVVK